MSILNSFAALNEESASRQSLCGRPDKASRLKSQLSTPEESEETLDPATLLESCLALYNKGLTHFGAEEFESAAEAFREVLDSKFVTKDFFAKQETSRKLRFNSLKYLGLCHDHWKDLEQALKLLIEAHYIDSDDVTLSLKIAIIAAKLGGNSRRTLAKAALENVLRLSPNHWPALDLIIKITFQLRDFMNCLGYLHTALKRDSSYIRGLQIRNAILKEFPEFECLCPDGPHIRKDLKFQEIKWNFPLEVLPKKRNPDDYHTITVGDITLTDFFELLVRHSEKLENKNLLPLFVDLEYKRTKPDPVEVSVQNVVQEIVDVISGPSAAQTISESIVEDLIDSALGESNEFIVSVILQEMLEDAVDVAKPSTAKGKGSFLDEVPLDLLDVRRSSRVRTANEEETGDEGYEMNAQAMLESFVPATLNKKKSTNENDKHNHKTPDRPKPQHHGKNESQRPEIKEDSQDSNGSKSFPSEDKQETMVKEFAMKVKNSTMPEIYFDAMMVCTKLNEFTWPSELKLAFAKAYLVWRDAWVLPNEFASDINTEYLQIMLLGNEMIVDAIREKDANECGNFEQFIEDDFLHFRLMHCRMLIKDVIRSTHTEHLYCLVRKKNEEALYYGKSLECLLKQHEGIVIPDWKMTNTEVDIQSLRKTMSYLEHSKILHRVQEFYDDGEFQRVHDILSETLDVRHGKVETDDTWFMRLFMLIESLWYLKKYKGCIDRCALALSKSVITEDIKDITNILSTLESSWSLLEDETMDDDSSKPKPLDISPTTAASLCESLISIMLGQINKTLPLKSMQPWTLFYKIIANEELKSGLEDDEHGIPHSAHFLATAHDYTGDISLCSANNGQLLILLIEVLTPLLKEKTTLPSFISDSIKQNLEQAMFCLYCHPSKKSKSKHLQDHGVSPLALTWDKCGLLFNVVKPAQLPEFDDFKSCSITSDTEGLLKRFIALVPDEFNLDERKEKIDRYFMSGDKEFPSFPSNANFPHDMLDMFYLLGDYNFKNSNFQQSIPYLQQDLSFNSNRLDSLVQLALASANELETKLSSSYSEKIEEILDESWAIIRIYRKCHRRGKSNPTIFIEGANFCIVMNAFCSRVFKGETSNLSMDLFTSLEESKSTYLSLADAWYSKAYTLLEEKSTAPGENKEEEEDETDERWLIHFFKGKIKEKRGEPIQNSLEEYIKAMKNLKSQGERIPKKISYTLTPQDLSQEFLEVYYRFHASILKQELNPTFKPTEGLLKSLKKLLQEVEELDVFNQGGEDNSEPPTKKIKIDDELSWISVADDCIDALERVRSTYPHHYKALHLLASYFMNNNKRRDANKAKEYLIPDPNASTKQPSLFGDRKPSNLFHGIWRNPVHELERAGSFPTHVAKCVTVLFNVLRETEDYNVFLEASTILKKSVDGDKQYLFEEDRKGFYTEACSGLQLVLTKKTEHYLKQTKTDEPKLRYCLDIFSIMRGKKAVNKQCTDLIRQSLKRLLAGIFKKPDFTHDNVTSFMNRLNAADKNGQLRADLPEKEMEKLLSDCANLVKHPEGNWTSPQVMLGADMMKGSQASAAAALSNSYLQMAQALYGSSNPYMSPDAQTLASLASLMASPSYQKEMAAALQMAKAADESQMMASLMAAMAGSSQAFQGSPLASNQSSKQSTSSSSKVASSVSSSSSVKKAVASTSFSKSSSNVATPPSSTGTKPKISVAAFARSNSYNAASSSSQPKASTSLLRQSSTNSGSNQLRNPLLSSSSSSNPGLPASLPPSISLTSLSGSQSKSNSKPLNLSASGSSGSVSVSVQKLLPNPLLQPKSSQGSSKSKEPPSDDDIICLD